MGPFYTSNTLLHCREANLRPGGDFWKRMFGEVDFDQARPFLIILRKLIDRGGSIEELEHGDVWEGRHTTHGSAAVSESGTASERDVFWTCDTAKCTRETCNVGANVGAQLRRIGLLDEIPNCCIELIESGCLGKVQSERKRGEESGQEKKKQRIIQHCAACETNESKSVWLESKKGWSCDLLQRSRSISLKKRVASAGLYAPYQLPQCADWRERQVGICDIRPVWSSWSPRPMEARPDDSQRREMKTRRWVRSCVWIPICRRNPSSLRLWVDWRLARCETSTEVMLRGLRLKGKHIGTRYMPLHGQDSVGCYL